MVERLVDMIRASEKMSNSESERWVAEADSETLERVREAIWKGHFR